MKPIIYIYIKRAICCIYKHKGFNIDDWEYVNLSKDSGHTRPKTQVDSQLLDHAIIIQRVNIYKKSKVSDHSRGWPEGSLFDSYYTKV